MRGYLFRFISGIFLSLFSMFYLSNVAASHHPDTEKSHIGTISWILSNSTHKSKGRIIVTDVGDGKVPEYIVKLIKVLPRIVVDIFCAVRLLAIRVRYHSQKIRNLFDITGSSVPNFSDKSVGNELIITLKSKEIENKNRTEGITNVDKQTKDITIITLS